MHVATIDLGNRRPVLANRHITHLEYNPLQTQWVNTPWTLEINWTHIRHSEGALDALKTLYTFNTCSVPSM